LSGGMQVQGGEKKGRPEPPHKSCWEGNILKKTRRKGVPVGKVPLPSVLISTPA
jgi:hypothetical protein